MTDLPTLFALACTACAAVDQVGDAEQSVATADVVQDASGAFSPFGFSMPAYAMVTWHFPDASPGHAVARRVPDPNTGAYVIAPYAATFTDEFSGPLITAPSGVFVLGPTGFGLVEQTTPCVPAAAAVATRVVGGATE